MYAPKYGNVSYEFEVFNEVRGERRPSESFRGDLFHSKRASETQEYVGRREDVE